MLLFAQLNGGCNYSHEDVATEYPSLAAVAREWNRRLDARYFPCWGDAGHADLTNDGRFHAARVWYVPLDEYAEHGTTDEYGRRVYDVTDMYPERDLTRGPRGGLRWETC